MNNSHPVNVPNMGLDEGGLSFTVNKLQAAHRQLNAAIWLLFSEHDPLGVLALAGNASAVFSDLVALRLPQDSWDRHAQQTNELTEQQYFTILRRGQNFLKHARRDADAIMTWPMPDTEAILLVAVLNGGQLDGNSYWQQAFRSWYFAKHQRDLGDDKDFVRDAAAVFPGITAMTPVQQRAFGLEMLHEARDV